MKKWYVVNDFLKNGIGKRLIHAESNKRGYDSYGDANEAARRINARLTGKGLAKQASVEKR